MSGHLLGKTYSTICSRCIMAVCNNYFVCFPHFCFEGGTLGLIAPVPGHCLPFNFLELR